MSEPEFEELFGPLRTGAPYRVFRRNVVAALGNRRHPDAAPLLRAVDLADGLTYARAYNVQRCRVAVQRE